ncbi:MAG: FmdB family transcriptional regulator [Caldilineales bacterium]|nr:FmdB family transcriptional regulator [Caldilineales bacterium]
MPIYEYFCETCQGEFEARQSFFDNSVPPCPTCNGVGQVHKKFSPPAIVFKGSGFYVTDSRGKNSAASPNRKAAGEGESPAAPAAASNGASASAAAPAPAASAKD